MSERAKLSSRSPEHACSLSDEEFERKLDDPSLIETHEEAHGIIREVMENVANIDMQIEVYRGEVAISGEDAVSPDRHAWYRRALYARMFRTREIDRVYKRDKELRGIVVQATQVKDRSDRVAKQVRLQAEAEERRAAKLLQVIRLQYAGAVVAERSSVRKHFVAAARAQLIPEMFDAIMTAAQASRASKVLEDV